jgi:toxin-antitoxin system PIN domain toxin
MRALDTNVLVQAEVANGPFHPVARALLVELAEGRAPWAIPWPCVYEFLRVVSDPRVFHPPMPIAAALRDLRQILASPSLVLLGETSRHAEVMAAVVEASGASGNLVHDAHIAALCLEHGVSELITGDRDFARFPQVRTFNPFV